MNKAKKKQTKNVISPAKQRAYNYSVFFLPAIVIVTAIVFANTLANGFIDNWDDNAYVIYNDVIKSLSWANIKQIFSSFYLANYHPLTTLTYAIEYNMFGLNPFPFHITNYIFHILNAALVYLFIKNFTQKPIVAFITALLFSIHPMHVESVAWISERKDVLYTFFFLLSLISYNKHLNESPNPQTQGFTSYVKLHSSNLVLSFVWFILSLLSKPAAVCLPVVLVLMDYYVYKTFSWRYIITKIHFFALALLFGILAVLSQSSFDSINIVTPIYNIIDRVFIASYSGVYYLFNVFFPFNLSALHYFPVKQGDFLPIEYYLSLPLLLLIVWGVIKAGKFKNELIFGLAFYLITIALVLQIIPIGRAVVSERYSYVPYIGIFFIFGQFFYNIKDKSTIKTVVSILLIVYTLMFSYITYERNKVWKDGMVLFSDVINKYPKQPEAYNSRGLSYSNHNLLEESLNDFNIAIGLDTNLAISYFNRGTLLGKIDKHTEAIADFTKTIELNPDHSGAYNNRGYSLMYLNKMDESIKDFNKAIELNPNDANVYFNRAIAYNKIGKFEDAIADFNIALKESPKDAEIYFRLGNVYININKTDSALSKYNKAIMLNPDYSEALNSRAIIYKNTNRIDDAFMDLNKAIEINSRYIDAYINRGNAYDKIGKYENAIADFNIALQLNPNMPQIYNNRGLALQNMKKIEESIRDFDKAIELNPQFAEAYFNRGIVKIALKDRNGVCNDWILALKYGCPQALDALNKYCK